MKSTVKLEILDVLFVMFVVLISWDNREAEGWANERSDRVNDIVAELAGTLLDLRIEVCR